MIVCCVLEIFVWLWENSRVCAMVNSMFMTALLELFVNGCIFVVQHNTKLLLAAISQ